MVPENGKDPAENEFQQWGRGGSPPCVSLAPGQGGTWSTQAQGEILFNEEMSPLQEILEQGRELCVESLDAWSWAAD